MEHRTVPVRARHVVGRQQVTHTGVTEFLFLSVHNRNHQTYETHSPRPPERFHQAHAVNYQFFLDELKERARKTIGRSFQVSFRGCLAQEFPLDARLGVIDGKVAGDAIEFSVWASVVEYNLFVIPATIFRNNDHND